MTSLNRSLSKLKKTIEERRKKTLTLNNSTEHDIDMPEKETEDKSKPPTATAQNKKKVSVHGTTPTGKVLKLNRTNPTQLALFQTYVGDDSRYSNTIELYDAIPKYVASRQLNRMRKHGTYLPILQRQFQAKSPSSREVITYLVNIKPARIEDKSGVKEYYPTEREELVEEALRKLASDSRNGIYLDDKAGVRFTLSQLRRELTERGHSIQHDSLLQALNICSETIIEVISENGRDIIKSPIFPSLLISSRNDWLEDPKNAHCYVQFNPLVTHCINKLTYRQFDYLKLMDHRSQLTRWLHKRLSHNFVQASISETYQILASTIINNSGVLNASRMRDNIRSIDDSLLELKKNHVLTNWEKNLRYGDNKRQIADSMYILRPAPEFVQEVRLANKRKAIVTDIAIRRENNP